MLSVKLHTKKILLVVCSLVILWLIFGHTKKVDQIDGNNTTNKNIKAEVIKSLKKDILINSYGIVDTRDRISIYPEITGKVKKKFVLDGSHVDAGQNIILIEVPAIESQLAKAQAALKQKSMRYDTDASLHKKGYISDEALLASFAALKAAEEDLGKIKDIQDKSFVKATISGTVNKINVSEGELVMAGNTLIAELIGPGGHIITCYLSEDNILKIQNGSEAFIAAGNNEKPKGKVSFISQTPEPHTKTYRVEISIDRSILSFYSLGGSASVSIKAGEKSAYKVPGSALILSDSGELGLKTIVGDAIKFIPVEVISQDADQFWIAQNSINKQELNIIILGANFVKDGDTIKIGSYAQITITRSSNG